MNHFRCEVQCLWAPGPDSGALPDQGGGHSRGRGERVRHAPFRPGLEAIAHMVACDATMAGRLSTPPGRTVPSRHGALPGLWPRLDRRLTGLGLFLEDLDDLLDGA